jgi:cobalt/nickel transport system permease protein
MTLAAAHLLAPDSVLRRLDPRWKLAALMCAAGVTAALHELLPSLAALAGACFLAFLGRLPPLWLLSRLATMLLLVGVFAAVLPFMPVERGPAWAVGPVQVYGAGLTAAARLLVKAAAVLSLMLILWATTAPADLFQAAHDLYVPGLLIQLTVLAYRYLFLLVEEVGRIRIALRVRGYRSRAALHSYRTVGHVAGGLLLRSSGRAERVGQAMRCRGFDGRFRSLAQWRTRAADVALFLALAGVTACLLLWDLWLR